MPPNLRLFLDANVIVSGLHFPGAPHELLVAAGQHLFQAVTSGYAMAEAGRVLVEKMDLPAEAANVALALMSAVIVPEAETPVGGAGSEADCRRERCAYPGRGSLRSS